MRARHPGRLREKVAAMLRAKGLDIHAGDIRPAQGAYRSRVTEDVYRWDAACKAGTACPWLPPDMEVHVVSWDTLTRLAAHGRFTIEQDGHPTALQVSLAE